MSAFSGDSIICFSCKVVKNLLKGGLSDRVLTDLEFFLNVFHQTKEVPDRVAVSRGSESKGVTVVFKKTSLFEDRLKLLSDISSLGFSEDPS